MANRAEKPACDIFVGGSPRAGTTALQLMLCQCAGTNQMIGEAEHFFGLFKLYDDVLGDFDKKTGHYMSRGELAAYHQGLALDYLETMRRRFGDGTRLVLKAAWWSLYLHHMAVMIENARFIVIVRDPLDIAASYMAAGKRNEAKTGHNSFPSSDLANIAHDIALQYAAMFNNKKKFGARLKAIKYE
ncbi:MAG: sulfotransferase, partial [Rhodospirillaceae bacterium]|nr:sulfotransferase [Rhodospirillaceae bacterium]